MTAVISTSAGTYRAGTSTHRAAVPKDSVLEQKSTPGGECEGDGTVGMMIRVWLWVKVRVKGEGLGVMVMVMADEGVGCL